jgi:hypothetical protein
MEVFLDAEYNHRIAFALTRKNAKNAGENFYNLDFYTDAIRRMRSN